MISATGPTRSPDHLTLEAALRRAELLSLHADDDLVAAVLATRLGSDLANATFWRTVMEFFVRVSDQLDSNNVGPIVDFLQAVRHERVEVTTPEGLRLIDPPEPHFSIKGRSLASIQRLVDAWHRRLGRQVGGALVWPRSRQQPLTYEERRLDPDVPPVRWAIVELTSSIDLRMEGQALQHCVASYAPYCAGGLSRIWSLRRITCSSTIASVATIEVNPRARAIVQARGLRNRAVSHRARELISLWARREGLEVR
jgi:PcfJ-like protein